MSLGLYLHIPYCFSKCRYCDFYSHPGERGVPDAYVDALLRELHRFAPDAPLRPVKYQMMIMVITFTASMLSLMITISLASRKSFDAYGKLREVMVEKKGKSKP